MRCVEFMRSASLLAAMMSLALHAAAQSTCTPEWSSAITRGDNIDARINAIEWFDDGSGPALYVTGRLNIAGNNNNSLMYRWNGRAWEGIGMRTGNEGYALLGVSDADGRRLYRGSNVGVHRWDGSSITPLLSVGTIYSFAALPITGDRHIIVAAGDFGAAVDGVPVFNIVGFDGDARVRFADGIRGVVRAVTVHDDGTGPALYAAGQLRGPDEFIRPPLARWNGTEWEHIEGIDPAAAIFALASFDDGSGPALYAAGVFDSADNVPGTRGIARWSNGQWSSVGGGLTTGGVINALRVIRRDGSPALFSMGSFATIGGTPTANIASWNGEQWRAEAWQADAAIYAAASEGDAATSALFIAGEFQIINGQLLRRIVRSVNGSFGQLEVTTRPDNIVWVLKDIPAADAPHLAGLYMGGDFLSASGQPCQYIARYEDNIWQPLAPGPSGAFGGFQYSGIVDDIEHFDDGAGPALYVSGRFTNISPIPNTGGIARWDGNQWSAVGEGANHAVNDILVFDRGDRTVLVAGGQFSRIGGLPAPRAAAWDGTSWTPLGPGSTGIEIIALAAHDDGAGPAIYAARASGPITRWDGSAWVALPGLSARSRAIESITVGGEPYLYVGLDPFTTIATGTVYAAARWNGSEWSGIGFEFSRTTLGFKRYDAGDGERFNVLTSDGAFELADDGTVAERLDFSFFAIRDVINTAFENQRVALFAGEFGTVRLSDDPIITRSSSRLAARVLCPRRCPGDANADGWIGLPDLALVIERWNEPAAPDDPADSNADGVINFPDLAAITARWHVPCP